MLNAHDVGFTTLPKAIMSSLVENEMSLVGVFIFCVCALKCVDGGSQQCFSHPGFAW